MFSFVHFLRNCPHFMFNIRALRYFWVVYYVLSKFGCLLCFCIVNVQLLAHASRQTPHIYMKILLKIIHTLLNPDKCGVVSKVRCLLRCILLLSKVESYPEKTDNVTQCNYFVLLQSTLMSLLAWWMIQRVMFYRYASGGVSLFKIVAFFDISE